MGNKNSINYQTHLQNKNNWKYIGCSGKDNNVDLYCEDKNMNIDSTRVLNLFSSLFFCEKDGSYDKTKKYCILICKK